MDSLVQGLILLFGLFLLLMFGVLVYFVWYIPEQCNNKGPSDTVATWSWNQTDGKCYPATCSAGTLNTQTHTCGLL